MIIYKATNKINNKVYIGQTSKSLEWRKNKYYKDSLTQNSYFYRAIRKYGFENFEWEVLDDTATTHEELNELEKFYIAQYESFTDKNKGYNSTSGGDHSYQLTPEKCQRRSERVQGSKNPMYGKPGTWKGKHFSDEHRANLSKALKGRPAPWAQGGNHWNAKKVVNLTTGEVFNSIKEAADKYGTIPDSISNCIRGISKSSMDCLWDYLENVDLNNLVLQKPKNHRSHKQPIIHVESGEEFDSISAAAAKFKCAHKSISDCVKGKREHYKNNHFIIKK